MSLEMFSHCKSEEVSPSDIMVGDTVVVGGHAYTVGRNTLPKNGFIGWTFDGQPVKKIKRILYPKWYKGERVGYVAQP